MPVSTYLQKKCINMTSHLHLIKSKLLRQLNLQKKESERLYNFTCHAGNLPFFFSFKNGCCNNKLENHDEIRKKKMHLSLDILCSKQREIVINSPIDYCEKKQLDEMVPRLNNQVKMALINVSFFAAIKHLSFC